MLFVVLLRLLLRPRRSRWYSSISLIVGLYEDETLVPGRSVRCSIVHRFLMMVHLPCFLPANGKNRPLAAAQLPILAHQQADDIFWTAVKQLKGRRAVFLQAVSFICGSKQPCLSTAWYMRTDPGSALSAIVQVSPFLFTSHSTRIISYIHTPALPSISVLG